MTQKELLYLEDAISHEEILIQVLEDSINKINDEKIAKFLKKEQKKHDTYKMKLMSFMEDMADE